MLEAAETPPLITSLPLTAEAREDMLDELFADELPHHGELFVPGKFYVSGPAHTQAKQMVKSLCVWLGIKPGYIGLEFESTPTKTAQGQRHSIYIESRVARDELLLGATLAHALVRYLLEERKQVHLTDAHDQLALAATGTIVFGLGLIIANGLRPGHAYDADRHALLGDLPLSEYGAMLHGFLWQRAVAQHAYENTLAPWAANLLALSKPKNPTAIVKQQYHDQAQKRYQMIGIIWILVLGLSIGGFIGFQRVKPVSSEFSALQEKVSLLQELKKLCDDSVAYSKQYSDTNDIQTLRSVNAEELRCTSINNQLRSTQQAAENAL